MPATIMDPLTLGGELSEVRAQKREATLHLLGETIRVEDEDWQLPSLLPGWTRAHVATHIARNADGMRLALSGLLGGRPSRMYSSETDKERDIERGSERSGLQLQIDLDISSGLLNEELSLALSRLDPGTPVELRAAFRIPLRLVPLARLNEVVLHHVDLGLGFTSADIDPGIARNLVEWTLFRLGDRQDIQAIEVRSSSGLRAMAGGFGDPVTIEGTDQELLGWLTGRSPGQSLRGNDDVVMPLLG